MSEVRGPDNAQEREAAFERLVEDYQAVLLRTCFLYLKDQALAEDAVQETFVKAYRHMEAFRGECSERTWLVKIAINVCRDLKRSAWFRFTDRRVTPDMLPEPAAPCSPQDEELTAAVLRLPVKLRETVLMYYYHGMTVSDMAKTLGISQSSVSGRLQRARGKLRDALEGRESHA